VVIAALVANNLYLRGVSAMRRDSNTR